MTVTKEALGNSKVFSVWISNGNKKMKTKPMKKSISRKSYLYLSLAASCME